MTDWFYKSEPRNLTTADVDERIRNFATAPSSFGSYAPRVIPFEAVNRPLVTALPLQPSDGDEVRFLADAAAGVIWLLRYRQAAQSIYRWEFLGGPPIQAAVATSQTTTSATFAALATAGPSITLPLPGDYDVAVGAKGNNNTDGDGGMMSYDIGSTGAVDADSVEFFQVGGTSITATNYRVKRQTGLSAVTLTAKYRRTVGGTAAFYERTLAATPVRVGRA